MAHRRSLAKYIQKKRAFYERLRAEGKFQSEPLLSSKIRSYVMQNSFRDYERAESVNRDITVQDIKDSLLALDGSYDSQDIPYLECGLVLTDSRGQGTFQL